LTGAASTMIRISASFQAPAPAAGLERRLLWSPPEMLTWSELAAYLSVVAAVCGGGVAMCWALLWRQ
jgi:hypothetical protein